MAKKTSLTQLSVKEMQERGYYAEVVEHWNGFARKTNDLFGFVDVLCLGDGEVVGVQVTSNSNVSARVKKITDHENVKAVRKSGIRILVQGWKRGKDGKWSCREIDCS